MTVTVSLRLHDENWGTLQLVGIYAYDYILWLPLVHFAASFWQVE